MLNKRTARTTHDELQASGASRYEIGVFYRAALSQQIWASQREMADALGVSTSGVSRFLALANIPVEVVEALGSPNDLTARVGELLLGALKLSGKSTLVRRAIDAKRLGYKETNELIEYIVSDRIPQQNVGKIRVRLARDKKSLRVELPELLRLVPHLSRLEEWLSASITSFEVSMLSQVAVSAMLTREARRSKPDGIGRSAESRRP